MTKQIANAFIARKLDEMTKVLDILEAQGYDASDAGFATWPVWAREKMHNIDACLQCAYRDLSNLDDRWN